MVVGSKKILLFNCDSDTKTSMSEFLEQEPDPYQFLTADNNIEVFSKLVDTDIFLIAIFTEECRKFPHSLLKKIIADHPQLEIILTVATDNDQFRSLIPFHNSLHIIERPYKPFSIIHLIRKLSSPKKNLGFTGTLKIVRLDDLIQMCCLSGATITILVTNQSQRGEILIQEGEIIHAQCGMLSGEKAFYAIMTWHNGGFETLDGVPPDKAATIKANYQYLLLEAARLSDEAERPFTTDDEEPLLVEAEIELPEANKLRVLMVEDSSIMAKVMSTMLMVSGDIEIAGIARNGREALEMMEMLQFDVILLDINMPIMNGRVTIKHIMIKSPCPVVIMSNVSIRAAETVLSLLDLGAVDFISKPVRGGDFLLQQEKIVERIRRSATARISSFRRFRLPKNRPAHMEVKTHGSLPAKQLVVISSGGNGHTALYHLLSGMPSCDGAAFVSLHSIPVTFLPAMSAHLRQRCRHPIAPVANDIPLQSGNFYLDSPRRSLLLQKTDNTVMIQSLQGQHNFEYCPGYFDLFLFSAADIFNEQLLVVLLSGAETSNLEGLRYVRKKGGSIIVQKRSKCMMPDCLTPVIAENLSNEELEPETLANRVAAWSKGYYQL